MPAIWQYIDALNQGKESLRTLHEAEFERNIYDEIVYIAGNNSAVFPLIWQQKKYLLKCYLQPWPQIAAICSYINTLGSPLLQKVELLSGEVLIDHTTTFDLPPAAKGYDALLARWVEGRSLEAAIQRAVSRRDKVALSGLSVAFEALSRELLAQPWAHGDLKPENIVVYPEGSLHLIDLDAMYVPGLRPSSVEIGTRGYQHPSRDQTHYNKSIDDYPIALMATSLRLLSRRPELYAERTCNQGVLLCPHQIVAHKCPLYKTLTNQAQSENDSSLLMLLGSLSSRTVAIGGLARMLDRERL